MSGNAISPKQARALELLLSGESRAEAAQSIGVNHRTLTRWLALPHVKAALRKGQASLLQDVYSELTLAALEAVRVLRDLLDAPSQPGAQVRARAAHSILSLLPEYQQAVDLEDRVSELEGLRDVQKN